MNLIKKIWERLPLPNNLALSFTWWVLVVLILLAVPTIPAILASPSVPSIPMTLSQPVFAQGLFAQKVFAQKVFAQETGKTKQGLSLSVSPPVVYLHVKPGGTLDHTLEVINNGNRTLIVTTNITDFRPDGKTGQPIIGSGSVFDKLINPNLDFDQPFELKPGENRSVNLQLKISQTAKQKEYPLTILFSAVASSSDFNNSENSSSVTGSPLAGVVGSNLILFVSPHEKNQGKLEIAQIKLPRLIDSFQPIIFEVLAQNTGANATPIFGSATVNNLFNQPISEYIFYPDYVLANSTRQVRGLEPKAELLDEQGKLIAEKVDKISTQLSHDAPLLIGPYKITIDLAGQTQSRLVIAFPFSILLVSLVGGLIYWGYNQLRKHFS
ncbi:MAG: hypothetical protein GF381_01385 [Candidatus Pacebacteria bacterium]|nr:hypothetical protein [Candidatus Paceibacterota bacterium]